MVAQLNCIRVSRGCGGGRLGDFVFFEANYPQRESRGGNKVRHSKKVLACKIIITDKLSVAGENLPGSMINRCPRAAHLSSCMNQATPVPGTKTRLHTSSCFTSSCVVARHRETKHCIDRSGEKVSQTPPTCAWPKHGGLPCSLHASHRCKRWPAIHFCRAYGAVIVHTKYQGSRGYPCRLDNLSSGW